MISACGKQSAKMMISFRLLNSEIGNDPSNIKMASEWGLRP